MFSVNDITNNLFIKNYCYLNIIYYKLLHLFINIFKQNQCFIRIKKIRQDNFSLEEKVLVSF